MSQVRAQRVRERLAPRIALLRRRHANDSARLQREIAALYQRENASPVAGCLPALIQAPILSGVCALFVLPTIAGHANLLLAHSLFGAPLGMSLLAAIGTGSPALIVVPAAVVAAVAVVALLARRRNIRASASGTMSAAIDKRALAGGPAGAPAIPLGYPASVRLLSWLPLITVAFAAFAPLAATVYLLTSSAWTLVERSVLLQLIPA